MGRRKLKIQRLECVKARQAKYSKRKIGLLKKAKELAILCDIDLALVMFSPTKKPSLYVGQDKDLSIVLERMSTLSFEEREQRL
ncbi:AGAMOUS-LIKE MADS-BOX PROTEIN AGL65 [Salix purpurea]|uniref:AGAMOUS-LIKE MADS-BOX PROTEIN AGL65 n=1 Tax=Salix purpurea TaxID=77065 RepID=A0A9Q0UMG3_SALPP|nr:AGAMOUS-LIKE MADS-BOX PROTEIN AGL65 [Salix purpurea]